MQGRTLPELYVPGFDGPEADEDGLLDSLIEFLDREKIDQGDDEEDKLFSDGANFYPETPKLSFETGQEHRYVKRPLQGMYASCAKKVKVAYTQDATLSFTDSYYNECYNQAGSEKFRVFDKSGQAINLCPFPGCSSKYKMDSGLRNHMAQHLKGGKRFFECDLCQAVFFSSGCLKSHKIRHIRQTSEYVCKVETCGKQYSTAEGLRLHTRNHHQINKNWKCMAEGCDRSFVRQADLRMHLIRMHCEERPYPCEHKGCRKAFACHSELRRHMEISHKVKIKKGVTRPPTKAIQKLLRKAHDYLKEKRKKLRERTGRNQNKN